jgi:hypothetical protein
MWSKIYRGCIYENPPRDDGRFLPVADLSYSECEDLVKSRALIGKPILREHAVQPVMGQIVNATQDRATGSVEVEFKLRTDSVAYADVCKREMLGLSLGHTVFDPTQAPGRRGIHAREVSVCKQGRRANTVIVNASASAEPYFMALPASATTGPPPAPAGMQWVPEGAALAQPPQKIYDTNGTPWVLRPVDINASAAAAAPAVPVAQAPPSQAAPVATPPSAAAAAAAAMETVDTRPRAPKRAAETAPAADLATDDVKDAETVTPPAAKKANTAKTGSSVPETPADLDNRKNAILKSNLSEADKAAMLDTLMTSYETQKQQIAELTERANKAQDTIEQDMRQSGMSDEDIRVWRAGYANLLAKPLEAKATIASLEMQARRLTGAGAGGANASSSSSSSSSVGPGASALQQQLDRYTHMLSGPQMFNQPVAVNSSAAAPPPFPVSTSSLTLRDATGAVSVFQPRFINPANLSGAGAHQVRTYDNGKGGVGWSVDGQVQEHKVAPGEIQFSRY